MLLAAEPGDAVIAAERFSGESADSLQQERDVAARHELTADVCQHRGDLHLLEERALSILAGERDREDLGGGAEEGDLLGMEAPVLAVVDGEDTVGATHGRHQDAEAAHDLVAAQQRDFSHAWVVGEDVDAHRLGLAPRRGRLWMQGRVEGDASDHADPPSDAGDDLQRLLARIPGEDRAVGDVENAGDERGRMLDEELGVGAFEGELAEPDQGFLTARFGDGAVAPPAPTDSTGQVAVVSVRCRRTRHASAVSRSRADRWRAGRAGGRAPASATGTPATR